MSRIGLLIMSQQLLSVHLTFTYLLKMAISHKNISQDC